MRNLLVLAFVSVGLLAGCGVEQNAFTMYKANTKYTEANKDLLACQVSAAQQVPVNNNSYTTPTWTTPVSCSTSFGYTNCTGGNTYGGNLITQDVNMPLRNRVTEQCLQDKGYSLGKAPICDNATKRKHLAERGGRAVDTNISMPKLSEIDCIYTDDGMNVVLVKDTVVPPAAYEKKS